MIRTWMPAFSIFFICFAAGAQRNSTALLIKNLTKEITQMQSGKDSLLIRKYLNDTISGYTSVDLSVPDSIVPAKGITYWEINSEEFGFWLVDTSHKRKSGYRYSNLYRSTTGINPKKDTVVLSKSANGFGSLCPPEFCSWYISAKKEDGTILTVINHETAADFIGRIDNAYDAFLWINCFVNCFEGGMEPQYPQNIPYKKVNNGYLMIVRFRVSLCPATSARMLYFIGDDRSVTLIQILQFNISALCI